jgi:hypothetical protein
MEIDKTTNLLVLRTLFSKPPIGQELFRNYILDEYGYPIVRSKKEAVRILDDPKSSFRLRVAATIFAGGYKEVMRVVQSFQTGKEGLFDAD